MSLLSIYIIGLLITFIFGIILFMLTTITARMPLLVKLLTIFIGYSFWFWLIWAIVKIIK